MSSTQASTRTGSAPWLKLSPVLETLPERLQLARQQKVPHQDFLELVLSDEVARRDRIGADLRARAATS